MLGLLEIFLIIAVWRIGYKWISLIPISIYLFLYSITYVIYMQSNISIYQRLHTLLTFDVILITIYVVMLTRKTFEFKKKLENYKLI